MSVPVVRSTVRSNLPWALGVLALVAVTACLIVVAAQGSHHATLSWSPILVLPAAPAWLFPALLGPLPFWPLVLGVVAAAAVAGAGGLGALLWWRRSVRGQS
jgi:hypothetical protein